MSKFAILSVFVLLYAHLPGGLASPTIVKRQLGEERRPVDAAPIEARQTSVVGGLTSVAGGVLLSAVEDFEAAATSVVGGVTSVVGGVTSVVGGLTSIVGGVLGAPTPSRAMAL